MLEPRRPARTPTAFSMPAGAKAAAEAAQKARSCEGNGKAEGAKTWRHVESAIKQMAGPPPKLKVSFWP